MIKRESKKVNFERQSESVCGCVRESKGGGRYLKIMLRMNEVATKTKLQSLTHWLTLVSRHKII